MAEVFGDDAEVVLQDVSDFNNSVISIRNNHISGRKLGAPATNLVLKVMNGNFTDKNYVTNYRGVSAVGKVVRSSTYFIKDDKNVVVGMLCINIDIDKLVQLKNHLDGILKLPEEIFEKTTERFSVSAEGLASDSIETILEESGISPERMSQEEKMEVVYKLDKNGVFLVKGSICKVASVLNVSNATIYRYLSKIRREV
ncbi:MAG: PAS domain-containing protein [Acidaminococcaceae bacterium]|nr:PAS domain-containing protein [Acidaminococcaceae bacterium]MBP8742779.1 PAS domain-containing protein [Acidaminococcaceae bacterium]